MEMVYIGNAYTFSYLVKGALRGTPINSYPLTLASIGYFPFSLVISWYAMFLADLSLHTKYS